MVDLVKEYAAYGYIQSPLYPYQDTTYQHGPYQNQFYVDLSTPPPNLDKMRPYKFAVITQLIIQMFILCEIVLLANNLGTAGFAILFLMMGGLQLLFGLGALMILITFIISVDYWSKLKDWKYLVCVISAVIGFFIGGYVLYLIAIP